MAELAAIAPRLLIDAARKPLLVVSFRPAGQISNALLSPAQVQLVAANAAQSLPLQNLAPFESLLTPLAALGSQTSGTSQGTTTQSVPLSQQIIGGAIGGLGLLNGFGLPLPKLFGPSSSGSQGG